MAKDDTFKVEGSERRPMPGARRVSDADANERVTVTVRVRRRSNAGPAPAVGPVGGDRESRIRRRGQLAQKQGADPADPDTGARLAADHGLQGGEQSTPRAPDRLDR